MSKPIKAEEYSWYQIDVEHVSSRVDYLIRVIATSQEHAEEKAERLKNSGVKIAGSTIIGKAAIKRYIKRFIVSPVPESVSGKYNMNNASQYENFLANREPDYSEMAA